MRRVKLIKLLELIKENHKEFEKLNLELNSVFDLDEKEVDEILDTKTKDINFFKLIVFLDKKFLNENHKKRFLKIISSSKKKISYDELIEIYINTKNNKNLLEVGEDAFLKYMINLTYILNTHEEPYQLKYAIKSLTNPDVFNHKDIKKIIDNILLSKEEYKSEYTYRITCYPNIMSSNYLLAILEMIRNSEMKEQAENVIMLVNSNLFNNIKNNIEIMKLIACSRGNYQAMYGQLAATDSKLLNTKNALYLISLITNAEKDYQAEYTYKALSEGLANNPNSIKLSELIALSKSRHHAMMLHKIMKNKDFLKKEYSYEILKILAESDKGIQVLYGSEIIVLAEKIEMSEKALENSMKIISNTKSEYSPPYIYETLKYYRCLKRDDLMNVLRFLSKTETEEEAKEVFKIFKQTLNSSSKETFNKDFRDKMKLAECEYEEKKLDEIVNNNNIEKTIKILKKSKDVELTKDSIIKIKKMN